MFRSLALIVAVCSFLYSPSATGQNPPPSDPQAISFAAQSIAAMTGGTTINDATLTGNVTWNGSITDSGTFTLRALGQDESRMDLALSSGALTEIRDAQTGVTLGAWVLPDNTAGNFAPQNCWTDAAWFFPVLGALSMGPTVVLSYVGQETRNGTSVQHLQAYQYIPGQFRGVTPQQLSTMDFYLDTAALLPLVITFNAHPDDNSGTNLLVEIDFSNYQTLNGITVPTHIQKYQQGNLMVDMTVTGAAFNTGLSLSIFAIN
jgi:hypothetical protein